MRSSQMIFQGTHKVTVGKHFGTIIVVERPDTLTDALEHTYSSVIVYKTGLIRYQKDLVQ